MKGEELWRFRLIRCPYCNKLRKGNEWYSVDKKFGGADVYKCPECGGEAIIVVAEIKFLAIPTHTVKRN